jgi:hypothetical protein
MASNEVKSKISILRNMSSEDLNELLRLDIHADSSDELDPNYILKILEVLEERNEADNFVERRNVNTAYQSFVENYLPYANSGASLYDWDDIPAENTSLSPMKSNPSNATKKQRRSIIKRYAAVAAVLIIMSTLFFSTTALGSSFWQSVAQWGRTTFGFSGHSVSIHMNDELEPLHEAITEQGINELIAPKWIPDRFELVDFSVHDLPEETVFSALFEYENNFLIIQVSAMFNQQIGALYERNDEEVDIFIRNGVEHYIMTNMDIVKAVWRNQNFECMFAGDITEEEAKQIINSIYER